MIMLDCEDLDSGLRSLAVAAGIDEPALRHVLHSDVADEVRPGEDPWNAIPRVVFAKLGVDINDVCFEGAYYFHCTRVLRPQAFLRDGIHPLGAMLARLWDDLYGLCDEQVTPAQWHALRRDLEDSTPTPLHEEQGARLYRLKFDKPGLHGPYASLVRDHVVAPISGHHDYLKCPEIIEDLAGCLGLGLQARFEAQAASCIVKFRHHEVTRHTVEAALLYVLTRVQSKPLGESSVYGLDCKSVAVPASDVVYVDEIDIAGRRGPAPVRLHRHRPPRPLAT